MSPSSAQTPSLPLLRARRCAASGRLRALRLCEPWAEDADGRRMARWRTLAALWPGLPAAPLVVSPPAAAVADPAAADALDAVMRRDGAAAERLWLDFDETDLAALDRAGALAGLARLKARGWRLALRLAADAPLALAARDRALFSELVVDGARAAEADPDGPLWTRLFAGRAGGAMLTVADADADQPWPIAFEGSETGLLVAERRDYAPVARSGAAWTASSLSSR